MKLLKNLVLTACLLTSSIANASLMFWLEPSQQTNLNPGDNISMTLMVEGLGNYAPDSLSTFDIDLSFDKSVLEFTSYSFFDFLGEVGFDAFDFSLGLNIDENTLNLYVISILLPEQLDDLQPSMFALAEIFFNVVSTTSGESSDLSLTVWDATNTANGLSFDLTDATITDATVTVPAPASLSFFGLAMIALLTRKKHV
ncbi:MAG: hypothetical protein NWQ54_08875 [Paraglaciecola sp.]|uniref:hypothetical protein n=1 Tax=Paraglaciecola sp. TaxID=1920173 RepID=UPI00273F2FFB|nr:hypothetical protein [Paraglaciecola sp.]MDP5029556.1 hypothetical protein [Paraglaciecola sp.]MDP5130986.1 hypothetical protein [Paraglaciecola sp.]